LVSDVMSDAELAMLFTEYFGLMQAHYINYISILFAFLAASYLVADKLNVWLIVVVIGLFTIYSLDAITALYYLNMDVAEIQRLMHERVRDGSIELAFHGAAKESFNLDAIDNNIMARMLVSIFGFLGSIAFFFIQRKTRTR